MMTYLVTSEEARRAGRTAEAYAAELGPLLASFGVTVEVRPQQPGPGGLFGCDDATTRMAVDQAVATIRTAGSGTIAKLNDDPTLMAHAPKD